MGPQKKDKIYCWSISSIVALRYTPVLVLLMLFLLESVASAQSLPFRIVEHELQKKGGSIRPLRSPRYVLHVLNAVLTDTKLELTKPNVEDTLRALLSHVRDDIQRRGNQVDGITVFLYQSFDHLKGGNGALGVVEWWPEGHSFGSENDANVLNKVTYVETVKVFSLPEQVSSVVNRFSEVKRREIFTAAVRSEDRAMKEAEAKYPIDPSNIPINKLRNYDWKKAVNKYSIEIERLEKKYERELRQKYKISESELKSIDIEGIVEQWPIPPQ